MTRAEAIDILKNTIVRFGRTNGKTAYAEALQTAIKALEEQPKTGEWNMCYDDDAPQDGIWFCSVCGYARFVDDISPQNFCPQCGARMLNGR